MHIVHYTHLACCLLSFFHLINMKTSRKCCISVFRANYTVSTYTRSFRFRKCDKLKALCTLTIPRGNFRTNNDSVVCIFHYYESDNIRNESNVLQDSKKILCLDYICKQGYQKDLLKSAKVNTLPDVLLSAWFQIHAAILRNLIDSPLKGGYSGYYLVSKVTKMDHLIKNPNPVEVIAEENDASVKVAGSTKNLRISGITEKTRAKDLIPLFSKYGKVSSLNILTDAKTPGTWYGLITMATNEEALLCIEKLINTELHGRIITVEKTTQEPIATVKSSEQSIQTKSSQKMSEKTAESSEVIDLPEDVQEDSDINDDDSDLNDDDSDIELIDVLLPIQYRDHDVVNLD